ncbi:hypothetical protein H0H93_003352, partial [Arthromyces matolae]
MSQVKPRCLYCHKSYPDQAAISRHVSHTPTCFAAWQHHLQNPTTTAQSQQRHIPPFQVGLPSIIEDNSDSDADIDYHPHREPSPSPEVHLDIPDHSDWTSPVDDVHDPRKSARFIEEYPGLVAEVLEAGSTKFEQWHERQRIAGQSEWAPFADLEEWELAQWLIKNVGQKSINEYLKLPIIQRRAKLSFHNTYTFLKKIDQLPIGTDWICDIVDVIGDRVDENGEVVQEHLELWHRDPVECVKELFGNPGLKDHIAYKPERVYTDKEGTNRIIDEAWTADWWWETQGKLPEGAVVAPVIIASDKTTLTQFQGNKVAWPVYMTLGNIAKHKRRQVSSNATVLIGYIPVSKLECFEASSRSLEGYRLFHHCMEVILKPLQEAGRRGEKMTCADGWIRRVFPILAAYIADFPEQCLVACCKENRCPRCEIAASDRGDWLLHTIWRDPDETLRLLEKEKKSQLRGYKTSERFEELGLRSVFEPFWKSLPHANIFSSFTPDILHQLHKGIFKDHLVKWCTDIIGSAEVDARFCAMNHHAGLRHFKKGISFVSQWTGTEHKEMEKIFVGIVSGAVNDRVLTVVRALLDFIYYARLETQTTYTLDRLSHSLKLFHEHKHVLVDLGIREHFNIPKLHNIQHYVDAILALGSADGYNTESPERLHIDFAKNAYRASNKRDYKEQMTLWLQRQEAVALRTSYLAWLHPTSDVEHNSYEEDEENPTEEPDLPRGNLENIRIRPQYRLALTAPFRDMAVMQLVNEYGAVDFLLRFNDFLQRHVRRAPKPSMYDRFDIYKQISVDLPFNRYLNQTENRTHRIRTIRPRPATGRHPAIHAHSDTALVIEDPEKYVYSWTMQGLRVAQVRVIFDLPRQFGETRHPLAYVEWFTPLGTPDKTTGMYLIKRSTRARSRNAEVISVDRIVRGCHLMAKCGRTIDRGWSTEEVLEEATSFW